MSKAFENEVGKIVDIIKPFLTSQNQSTNEIIIPKLKLKFIVRLASDRKISSICENAFQNFEHKLFSLALSYYLNTEDSYIEQDLVGAFMEIMLEKYPVFNELNLKFKSNIEDLFSDFIANYSYRLRLIDVYKKF